jgi:hypothetical protein
MVDEQLETNDSLENPSQDDVTDESKKDKSKKDKFKKRYFRTHIAGLSVVVGKPKGDSLFAETVRFRPVAYVNSFGNTDVKGFLATDNPVAIEKCVNDPYVEEISASDFKDVMKQARDESNVQVKFSR